MPEADRLVYVGPPDQSGGIINIQSTDTSANRVLVFKQTDANPPHHYFEWLLEVEADHSVILMRVERDANGHPVPNGWRGVCRFRWDGHVQQGPFSVG